jgi:hypothetical protein
MSIQLAHLLVPLQRKRSMSIGDRCLALPATAGDNANSDLFRGESGRHDYVFNPAFFNIEGGEDPESLLTRLRWS